MNEETVSSAFRAGRRCPTKAAAPTRERLVPVCWQIICLLCDSRTKTLRRLRPHKLYACQDCLKAHNGAEYVVAHLDEFKSAFIERHCPTTLDVHHLNAARKRTVILVVE